MPHFNKGVYRNIKFDARPARRFSTISSIFRWYRPYAPGDKVDFDVITKSHIKDDRTENMVYRLFFQENGGACEHVGFVHVKPNGVKNIESYAGKNLSGQGSFDYRMGLTPDDSVVLVSVVATHNDAWMLLIAGGIVTLICSIPIWLLGFIEIIPFRRIWIP